MTQVYPVRGIEHCSAGFLRELVAVASRLDIDPNWLLAVISFETGGTFDPAIRNPGSSATGLIQFMESTARRLGTTTAELASMTATEQLAYVEQYFAPVRGAMSSLCDCYAAVFWPNAMGQTDSYVALRAGSAPYRANSALDRNGDGTITRGEMCSSVRRIYAAARACEPIEVDHSPNATDGDGGAGWAAMGVVVVLMAGLFAWTLRAGRISHA